MRAITPGGSDLKESTYNAGELGSVPGLGRSPGGGNADPLQYSCLGNPCSLQSGKESDTTEQLTHNTVEVESIDLSVHLGTRNKV